MQKFLRLLQGKGLGSVGSVGCAWSVGSVGGQGRQGGQGRIYSDAQCPMQ
ncbi:hypothetical protein ACE1AT_15905 [Pelatocladus sp. BLCC-F211]